MECLPGMGAQQGKNLVDVVWLYAARVPGGVLGGVLAGPLAQESLSITAAPLLSGSTSCARSGAPRLTLVAV